MEDGTSSGRWVALIAMLLAAAMDLLDTTIVNVAIPAIHRELGAGPAATEWVVAGYALAFGIGLITGARAGDIFGRKRVFLAGVGGFMAASLLSGLAPSPAVLIVGRLAQGGAAAAMVPQILTIIQVSFPAGQRSGAFAAYGGTAAIATVSGPLVGVPWCRPTCSDSGGARSSLSTSFSVPSPWPPPRAGSRSPAPPTPSDST
jgi:MFS family permease